MSNKKKHERKKERKTEIMKEKKKSIQSNELSYTEEVRKTKWINEKKRKKTKTKGLKKKQEK